MPRTIIPEEQKEEVQNTEQQVNESQTVNKISDVKERVVISSDELKQLFYEWDCTGKNDLIINDSLAGKIEAYLAYQETIKPLKIRLAEEQFNPFLESNINGGHTFNVYVNSVNISKIFVLNLRGIFACMYFKDFRSILCLLKNPFAFYAYPQGGANEEIINVRNWVLVHGGSFVEDEDAYNIRIDLQI